jgi:hypothetical protein
MYPDYCVQQIIADPKNNWWVRNEEGTLCRGAIVFSFVPHFDQTPYTFEPIGRTAATEHNRADVKVEPLKVDRPLKQVALPVAAAPLYRGEVWAAYKAKKRPCLVLGDNAAAVDKSLTLGMPKSSSASTVLVAPYYGADKDGTRAGYNKDFVERIRHCEYPQFIWDMLPLNDGPEASILRLDQLQPIGTHYNSYKVSDFKLSKIALEIVDDVLKWLIWGGLPEESDVLAYKELIIEVRKEDS